MKAILELIESQREFKELVMQGVAEHLNAVVPKSIVPIEARIYEVLKGPFKKSDVYEGIVSGTLAAHFGIVKGQERARIEGIINVLASQIRIRFKPLKVSASGFGGGGIIIHAIEADFEQVVATDFGVTINTAPATKQFQKLRLPWLQWLLFRGGEVIISEYKIVEGNFTRKQSRSGTARMEPEPHSYWSVPLSYHGTANANFVTEAIAQSEAWLETEFLKIIQEELGKVL